VSIDIIYIIAMITLDRVEFTSVKASDFTEWAHAEFFDLEGSSALVEFTPGFEELAKTTKTIVDIVDFLAGRKIIDEKEVNKMAQGHTNSLQTLHPTNIAASAVRTAIASLQYSHNYPTIFDRLDSKLNNNIPLYANINRALLGKTRSPLAFAKEAERAAARGFETIKCAPFDEVDPSSPISSLQPGIDRVAAIRSAVGTEVELLVDCHSRFNIYTAIRACGQLEQLGISWFEEPVDPTSESDNLTEISNHVDVPIAGGERGYGAKFFRDIIQSGAVEIIMPDIKFCGGTTEAWHTGTYAVSNGAGFSLHSPSGPVSLLSSAQVTALVPGSMALEHAVNEVPWRADLLDPPERIESGRLWFPKGFAKLDPKIVDRYGQRWKP
jgi:galactonate dehydratase